MAKRRYYRELLIGSTTLLFAMLTALATEDRTRETVEAPVDEIVAEAVVWDLPVTRNDRVDRWIDYLAGRNHKNTATWIARSGRYEGMIRQKLRERGMPEDLIYLAFIESGFSPKAYSHAHASGLWQFISETGRRYGLEVSGYVDERRDPIRSTDAALSYLQDLHARFGSWYLAAAAYNSGENRVERLLNTYADGARGSDSLFWAISPHLPRETRDYVPLMLAAGHVDKERAKYEFDKVELERPLAYDSVMIAGGTSLSSIARAAGVDPDTVRFLNAHLVKGMTPPGEPYKVRLPEGRLAVFGSNFAAMLASERLVAAERKKSLASMKVHAVRKGETLDRIARRYGVSVNALKAENGVDPRRLQVGKKLRIPGDGAVRVASSSGKSSAKSTSSVYRVRRGDTLSEIAARNKVSVRQIQAWNGLGKRSVIRPGQRLKVST